MTPEALRDLLRHGEGQRLEFKEDAIKPGDLAQTLVGMANAQGGVVLLGVNDAGQPVGIHSYKDAVDLVMTAASHELCDPPIRLTKLTSVVSQTASRSWSVTVPSLAQTARDSWPLHGAPRLPERGAHNDGGRGALSPRRDRRADPHPPGWWLSRALRGAAL